jgi:hypothetical protein
VSNAEKQYQALFYFFFNLRFSTSEKLGGWWGSTRNALRLFDIKCVVTGITVVSRATGRPSSTALSSARCELLLSVGSGKWVARCLL